jgi:hypothetical protein
MRRSSWFGIVGVLVVMVACAFVGLTMGQGDANPKDAYAVIFAIVGGYLVLLFLLQSRDLSVAEAADARASTVAPHEIENPAMVDEPTLFSAMAVHPVDADAIRARKQVWATSRSSIRLGMLICALIFLTVPPIYLLETFVPLIVGVPLIAGIALWKSVGLMTGGLDDAYEAAGRAMAPLGLEVVEQPTLTIEAKSAAPFRAGPALHGALVLEGRRHGRAVTVNMPTTAGVRSPSEVLVAAPSPAFEFKTRDGRLKAAKDAPAAVQESLKAVPNSPRWNGVRGEAGPEGVAVRRKSAAGGDMLLDLWLAERVASAARAGAPV